LGDEPEIDQVETEFLDPTEHGAERVRAATNHCYVGPELELPVDERAARSRTGHSLERDLVLQFSHESGRLPSVNLRNRGPKVGLA
jgi:hypothetical protein